MSAESQDPPGDKMGPVLSSLKHHATSSVLHSGTTVLGSKDPRGAEADTAHSAVLLAPKLLCAPYPSADPGSILHTQERTAVRGREEGRQASGAHDCIGGKQGRPQRPAVMHKDRVRRTVRQQGRAGSSTDLSPGVLTGSSSTAGPFMA